MNLSASFSFQFYLAKTYIAQVDKNPMNQDSMDFILKQPAGGKTIRGVSLIRIDGEVISSYFEEIQGSVLNLLARESLSAKKGEELFFRSQEGWYSV